MNSRQRKILQKLQLGRLDIKSAATFFSVSEMTIRRDFAYLASLKLLIPVKGGAVSSTFRYEPDEVSTTLTREKMLIASALYDYIMPCKTVLISTGSTALAFAKFLSRNFQGSLTVLSNALPVASTLFKSPCRVILLGGELRSSSLDLVGPLAESNLSQYRVDWLISGCDGALSDCGFYTSDFNLSSLEKKSIEIASKVAIICESKKFGQQSLTKFVSTDKVDLLVTDDKLPEKDKENLLEAGVEIVLVGD